MIRLCWATARFQLLQTRNSVNEFMVLVTLPLMTLAFLAILVDAHRRDLAPYGVVGSAITALWGMAVNVSGGIVERDRRAGTLEATVVTPAPLALVLVARITAVSVLSLLGLVESALVAWLAFGIRITVFHPAAFLLTLAGTVLAVAGTATALSGIFVLGPWALTFQSALTYPVYVLGGALVPLAYLPGWLHPFSKLVFLSWTADLLRDSLRPEAVHGLAPRLAVLTALGLAALGLGLWSIDRVVHRLRVQGTVGRS